MKIALLGYGRMGKTIEKFAQERNHEIVFILDKNEEKGSLAEAEVAINFSVPEAAVKNIKLALGKKIPVICGTTGWLDFYDEVTSFCNTNKTAFLYASNFSIGVNLFFKINELAAKLMKPHSEEYKPSIQEIHHIHKLDAPSGTAITIAESLVDTGHFSTWELNGTTDKKLNIESVREGEVPGTHSITYHSQVDEISLKHEAFSRDGFALGAVIAAEWILNKKGVFSMQDVLNIS
ncbi:4-hydroxy-tetrahydrodipicolinate reductase [Flavobacteriaceae bacterium]|mgnify:FL=1|jgi:4-hydroxy-tetrahydrodipicolinate reductase|nr:4-hydroxy-tetrahydrodipicolinate reductase [Flavobacteriaceae bacterium]MDA9365397.1 4-hydroxy-tetrahydrodipicolinate reductase [Flavobacteriaceae bacterium]MDA9811064.1 4-hydroxy-tetrahydrodipicolinate reductase [Flavobacteriaceae bacterium]MDC1542916.1 4-hydroxy-tetrahydrodipicolinate reductase [Flavobacteriaceae bacterium]MDG1884209.1 4-hydroxy-tetrahydrodipicolinate reductase [Flavobacteriaceae bacterium]|tara:strand:+ start:5419 stop:6123 length:705 start_codon:yes stop_codon:yes gene_type:complete